MWIIVAVTKTTTANICAENKYATSFSVVLIQPITDAIRSNIPGNTMINEKDRDCFVKPLLFKITSRSANALINGNVNTGQSPETHENKLSFHVDLSVGFILPPYFSGRRNQIIVITKLVKLDKKIFKLTGDSKKYFLILEYTKNKRSIMRRIR